MSNQVVRSTWILALVMALCSGALAKASKEPGKKPPTKSIVTKKTASPSKETAARQARLKKIGSNRAKVEPKATHPTKTPEGNSASPKKHQARALQIASNSDGGSINERRARIHSMRVPE